jgi:glyceraldehyde-3-phosphate dehydrogenase (NAD(P))
MGMEPSFESNEAIDRASVIIDCTPAGNENKQERYSRYANNGRGFIAQGSEFGFGKMYARGINDTALDREKDRFIQVVSCNTHNLAALIDAIALGSEKENNLREARFVCMRRADDISQEGNFIPSPEVDRHDDARFGTHQGRDAHFLFETLGLDLDIFSSTLRINSQYMHTIFFSLALRRGLTLDEVMRRLRANPRIALTNKKSSASVFSFGRDHGVFGRILNQTVIVAQSLALKGDREVVGICFTPQDGNSLLSSIASTLWYLEPESYEQSLKLLQPYLFREI